MPVKITNNNGKPKSVDAHLDDVNRVDMSLVLSNYCIS